MKYAIYALFCIFAIVPISAQSQYKVLYAFGTNGSNDGDQPTGGLTLTGSQLFGVTSYGGTPCTTFDGCGTVFAMESFYGTPTEAVIYRFCPGGNSQNCPDGSIPNGPLLADTQGNLYGTTEFGGQGSCSSSGYTGCGTVFELTKSAGKWNETVLYRFSGPDGANPYSGLISGPSGELYAVSYDGGAFGYGNVFSLTKSQGGWSLNDIHDFTPSTEDGSYPIGSLVFDSAGNLFGTTALGGDTECNGQGCGTVFELSPGSNGTWTENVIYRLGDKQAFPYAGVTLDEKANIYGTTAGGYNSDGSVYKLTLSSGVWKESAFLFNGFDGYDSTAAALIRNGVLYGTTTQGGAYQGGTIFQVKGGQETVLYNFCPDQGCLDGGQPPQGGPLLLINGSFYGMANAGGLYGHGVIFQFTP